MPFSIPPCPIQGNVLVLYVWKCFLFNLLDFLPQACQLFFSCRDSSRGCGLYGNQAGCWWDRRASLLERTKVITLTVWYRSRVGIPLTFWAWNEWELPLQWFGVRSGEWQWSEGLGKNEKNKKAEAEGETWGKTAAPLSLMSFAGSHLCSGTLGGNFGASISFFPQTLYC